MEELIARRQFAPLYIWLDIAFLCVFLALLLWKRKYMTVLVGLVMGLVYMLVDYGIFHLVCHSRSITGGSLFWVLLWMSMSYGFTNFTWIWLWLSKDKHLLEWSLLILSWWFCCPLLTQTFAPDAAPIIIERTTGAYHGYMALILFVGYLGAIVYNLRQCSRDGRINLLWLLAIGVLDRRSASRNNREDRSRAAELYDVWAICICRRNQDTRLPAVSCCSGRCSSVSARRQARPGCCSTPAGRRWAWMRCSRIFRCSRSQTCCSVI